MRKSVRDFSLHRKLSESKDTIALPICWRKCVIVSSTGRRLAILSEHTVSSSAGPIWERKDREMSQGRPQVFENAPCCTQMSNWSRDRGVHRQIASFGSFINCRCSLTTTPMACNNPSGYSH